MQIRVLALLLAVGLGGCTVTESAGPADGQAGDGQAGDGPAADRGSALDRGAGDMRPLPGFDLGAACQVDDDCEGPRRCLDGICVACQGDADCVAGFLCREGECAPGCRQDRDCPLGNVCTDGACAAGCGTAAGDQDARCLPGAVCVGGACVACAGLDPCAEALPPGCVSDPPPVCGCRADAECEAGQICAAGDCRAGCRPGGCPEGSRCDPASLTCELEAPLCVDVTLYPDVDADGFGVQAGAVDQCLPPEQTPAGYAREAGDCAPIDPWANPAASEICGDQVDDDCDGVDAPCPASAPAIQVPDWDCAGAPPASVVAFARFANGGGYFQNGGCFFFFEGLPGEFYVKRVLTRASNDASCGRINGCTCPSLNGWPSYDRRLYAFTLAGDDPAACPPIEIIDHGGERQAVSNHCRKYLYQMHFYDIPYSYVAPSLAELERRLALFGTVEVACAADLPHANLPYQSLLTAPVERNPGWRPRR